MSSFSELNLSSEVLRAIQELGYESPSPIQAQALPILLGDACDFMGLAATGTGKTAAFAIPMLERIDPVQREVQALILCPTRELAMQVTEQVNILGKYLGVTALPIYGGASYTDQHRGLHQGLPVVVGTPGRICDHIRRGTLSLDSLQVMILDEADEMISMGFKDDLTAILDCLPEGQCNTWLFSATMSGDVRRVADTYLKNPQQVQVNRTEMVPTQIDQRYFVTHDANKPEVLRKLIDSVEDFYGLVFCQTKALVSDLTMYLLDMGYRVDSLHGDKSQAAREMTMRAFRERKVKLLICTDVAARGLDVKDVTHVINYSIPKELDSYVHRIGRTARCGKSGAAFSLISPRQRSIIGQIERLTKSKLQEGVIPTRKELGAKKVAFYLSKFQEPAGYARAVEALGEGWKEALAALTPEEIAGRFLALTFPEIFAERDPDRGGGNGFPSNGFPGSSGDRGPAADRPRPSRSETRIRPQTGGARPDAGRRSSWRDDAPRGGATWDNKPKVKTIGEGPARITRTDDVSAKGFNDEVKDWRRDAGTGTGEKVKRPKKKFPAAGASAGPGVGAGKFSGKPKKPAKKAAWSQT